MISLTLARSILAAVLASLCCVAPVFAEAKDRVVSVSSRGTSQWSGKPPRNVLFIVLDATSAQHMANWGYNRTTTPIIDEFAKSGMVFLEAHSQAPSTLPSTASFLTGMPAPYVPKEGFSRWIRKSDYTVAQAFRAAGFATGGFSENAWVARAFGFSQGFAKFRRFKASTEKFTGPIEKNSSKQTMDTAVRWMGANSHRRWFCYVHLLRPHFPFNPPDVFRKAFIGGEPFEILPRLQNSGLPRRNQIGLQMLLNHYDGNLLFADHLVGEVLDALRQSGALEKTLVIIASDHGEAFWEHGLKGHNRDVFEELIHVPLLIRAPASSRFKTGESSAMVDMIDIFPTLAGLYGLDTKEPLAGTSMLPLLTGASGHSKEYSVAATTYLDRMSVRKGNLKVIFDVDESRQVATPRFVFDLSTDPKEQENLLSRSGVPEDFQRVASEHIGWARVMGNLTEEPTTISERQIEELKAIGYLK